MYTGRLFQSSETRYTGTGLVHRDHINTLPFSPEELQQNGAPLVFFKSLNTSLGNLLLAATERGVCWCAFFDDEAAAVKDLLLHFPQALPAQETRVPLEQAAGFLFSYPAPEGFLNLHLKGTPFQISVWKSLLKIPLGETTTYQNLALHLGLPGGARAVGTAIGNNPAAFLVPCHRVIQSTGGLGGFRWGLERKRDLLIWELQSVKA